MLEAKWMNVKHTIRTILKVRHPLIKTRQSLTQSIQISASAGNGENQRTHYPEMDQGYLNVSYVSTIGSTTANRAMKPESWLARTLPL